MTEQNGELYYYIDSVRQKGERGWIHLSNGLTRNSNTTLYAIGERNYALARDKRVIVNGDTYYITKDGYMAIGKEEIHGDFYLFGLTGKLSSMLSGTDTYSIIGHSLEVWSSYSYTSEKKATLIEISTVTVPIPKAIKNVAGKKWIEIYYEGKGIYGKTGWVELDKLEEYYPLEGSGNFKYVSIYGNQYEEDGWFPLDTIEAANRWGNQLAMLGYNTFVYENAIKGHMFNIEPNTGAPPTNAEIFIFSGHGTEDSQLILYDKEVIDYGDFLNSFNERNEPADFKNCRLAIFLACNTADKEVFTEVGGILSAAVECGAKAAFGFVGSIKIDSLMRFMDYMLERLIKGDSIGVAAGYAQDKIVLPMLKPDYYIHGDASTRLSLINED